MDSEEKPKQKPLSLSTKIILLLGIGFLLIVVWTWNSNLRKFATYPWSTEMDLSESHTFESDWLDFEDKHVHVTINRSALDPVTNTVDVSAEVTAQRSGAIVGIWLLTGTDGNSNSNLEESEWLVFGEGSVVSEPGLTTATIPDVTIGTDFDGYRLLIEWGDGSEGVNEILRPGFTSDW